MTKPALLECVPNFSEGRNSATIQAIADAIRGVPDVYLLHIDSSAAANRTVMTFVGEPRPVTDAAFAAIKAAAGLIDMRTQEGVHPRIGATDVCPLIPLQGMSIEEADVYAQQLGNRVGEELDMPVYMYEFSARESHRRTLPQIRSGQYEGLAQKMQDTKWIPDYGPAAFNGATGALVLGVRNILVAFNISLASKDAMLAQRIAEQMRSIGYKDAEGLLHKGLLPKLRAIGWYLSDFASAQVSMNLLDYRITSPLQVWNTCKELAAKAGVGLTGSELIGLIPQKCLLQAGAYALGASAGNAGEDELIASGIAYLQLDKVKRFAAGEHILEKAIRLQTPYQLELLS